MSTSQVEKENTKDKGTEAKRCKVQTGTSKQPTLSEHSVQVEEPWAIKIEGRVRGQLVEHFGVYIDFKPYKKLLLLLLLLLFIQLRLI